MTQFGRKRKEVFQNKESMQYIYDIIKKTDFVIKGTMKELEEDCSPEPAMRALIKGMCSMCVGASLCGLIVTDHSDSDLASDIDNLFKNRNFVKAISFMAQIFILAFLGCS